MNIVRRVNMVIAACITAAFCALAGSQAAAWMVQKEGPIAPLARAIGARAIGSTSDVLGTDQPESSVNDAAMDRQEPSLDLYGNEVTSAVATYKLDPAGTVYEEHSPQTEVLPAFGQPDRRRSVGLLARLRRNCIVVELDCTF